MHQSCLHRHDLLRREDSNFREYSNFREDSNFGEEDQTLEKEDQTLEKRIEKRLSIFNITAYAILGMVQTATHRGCCILLSAIQVSPIRSALP
jgi:hypothetical protein